MSNGNELVTNSIVPRITAVLTAAEQTAALVTEEAESQASRRASELIAIADADAERIRREATRRVEEYLTACRRRIDAFATARIERITDLTEGVIDAVESIQARFEQAAAIQREVHAMVEALGTVAEAVASEAAQAAPTLPPAPGGASREHGPSWAKTGPDGAVVGETFANGRVRGASSDGDPNAEDRTEHGEREENVESGLGGSPGTELDGVDLGALDMAELEGDQDGDSRVASEADLDGDDAGETDAEELLEEDDEEMLDGDDEGEMAPA